MKTMQLGLLSVIFASLTGVACGSESPASSELGEVAQAALSWREAAAVFPSYDSPNPWPYVSEVWFIPHLFDRTSITLTQSAGSDTSFDYSASLRYEGAPYSRLVVSVNFATDSFTPGANATCFRANGHPRCEASFIMSPGKLYRFALVMQPWGIDGVVIDYATQATYVVGSIQAPTYAAGKRFLSRSEIVFENMLEHPETRCPGAWFMADILPQLGGAVAPITFSRGDSSASPDFDCTLLSDLEGDVQRIRYGDR